MDQIAELAILTTGLIFVISILLVWTIIWKGLALWKSARNSQKGWFIALLIVNTLGILEIIYIFLCQKNKSKNKK